MQRLRGARWRVDTSLGRYLILNPWLHRPFPFDPIELLILRRNALGCVEFDLDRSIVEEVVGEDLAARDLLYGDKRFCGLEVSLPTPQHSVLPSRISGNVSEGEWLN